MSTNLTALPKDLPRPVDDGAGAHLQGMALPDIALRATGGGHIRLAALAGRVVIYIYPMTGRPDVPLPAGWDGIPGARGCTPQSCAFRDHHAEFRTLDTCVYGLSAQSTDYQREARDRLHLPFELLSDSDLRLKQLLRLPTFTVEGRELYKRLTLIAEAGRIRKVFYPVFPPDRNAPEVLEWLGQHHVADGEGKIAVLLTAEKIAAYARFDGDLDGWTRSRLQGQAHVVSDAEWREIDALVHGLRLTASGLASDAFAEDLGRRLAAATADESTREQLRRLAAVRTPPAAG